MTSTTNGTQADSVQMMSFASFSELPPELRLQIWKESMEGRVVEVQDHRIEGKRHRYELKFIAKIPAIMHINRETRTEALKSYTLAFDTEYHSSNRTYFNFSLDILYIRDKTSPIIDKLTQEHLRKVERLALNSLPTQLRIAGDFGALNELWIEKWGESRLLRNRTQDPVEDQREIAEIRVGFLTWLEERKNPFALDIANLRICHFDKHIKQSRQA